MIVKKVLDGGPYGTPGVAAIVQVCHDELELGVYDVVYVAVGIKVVVGSVASDVVAVVVVTGVV